MKPRDTEKSARTVHNHLRLSVTRWAGRREPSVNVEGKSSAYHNDCSVADIFIYSVLFLGCSLLVVRSDQGSNSKCWAGCDHVIRDRRKNASWALSAFNFLCIRQQGGQPPLTSPPSSSEQ